ncbi:MAG: PAS domain S-box protein [Thermodesulfobacteriota bacterium]
MNDRDRTREELMHELERLRELLEKGAAGRTTGDECVFTQRALDVLSDAFVVFDFQGRFLYWNRAVRDISGYEDHEISAMNPLDFFSPDDRQPVSHSIALAATQGHASLEASVITKDGKAIPFEFTGDLLKDQAGKAMGICVVGRDIARRKQAEEALVESEARYRSLMEAAPDPIVVYDTRGLVTYLNPAFTNVFGWTLEERLGRTLDEFVPEDRIPETRAGIDRVLRGEPVISLETRRLTKDGRILDIEVSASVFSGSDGKLAGSIVIHRDVSDKKAMEKAVRESREEYRRLYEESRRASEMYRTLLDASPDPIVVYDIQGIPLYLNPAFTRVFGWTFEDVRGKKIDFVPPEHWPETRRHIGKIVKGENFYDFETKRYTRDGRVIDVSLSGSSFLDEDGLAAGSVIQLRDITERTRSEQALKESEERYRLLTQNSLTGIYIHQDGRFVYVNERLGEILGWSPDEMIGQEFWRFVYPEDLETVKARGMARSLGEKVIPQYEFRVVCKDGATKWLDVLATTIMYHGRTANMGNVADITHRKRLEEQLRQALKMEAIGRLAGGIAHDFNNLLTAMIGYSNMLLQQMPQRDAHRDKIVQINRAADRAAELTRQLLAFSRKQVLQVAVIDLNDVVTDLEKMLRRLIGEDINLVTALRAAQPRVRADPGQVEQIMVNLAVNARDAMREGGTLIIETANMVLDEGYTKTHMSVKSGMYVMLAFSDTGEGMDADTLSRIFEPFFTTKPKGRGTGLGLSTVYGIVKQHEGHIEAYGEPGRGTTFKVYLPCVDALAEPMSRTGIRQPQRGTETVLIVEDEEMVLDMACESLESFGYRVLRAGDPERALEVCRTHESAIDLLLTDVVLPRTDGRTLYRDIAAARPGIKVLYMSGYTANAIVHRGVLERGLHFLQKPFTMDELARRVREVLDQGSQG